MIIAVDGPAGAGKSTVAKKIAQKMGFLYIDTGAMYRGLTFKVLEMGIDINKTDKIIEVASKCTIALKNNPNGTLQVILDGQDVSAQIREPRITKFVSEVARIKEVRQIMVELQRKFGHQTDCVLDGRDIGTVVFPDADKKFYLDANLSQRVTRRHKELSELGKDISWQDVHADLNKRDTIDSTREVAPLKKADDAVYIDTTDMSINEVVDKLLQEIKVV